ncbi:MAG: hypothetical protein HY342_03310 [Candidatus Lambdaproteobacteria bacterium]|nr:hypothetical protein [Candidatus Lambdaproteobacteria bacterium]
MPITPNDLIQLAERWLEEDSSEATIRAAASRGYYAAFHVCRELHHSICPISVDEKIRPHKVIIDDFSNFANNDADYSRKINALGAMLKHARSIRSQADYELEDTFEKITADQLLQTAKRIISKISALPHN